MDQTWELFKNLVEAVGVSGFERNVSRVLERYLAPHGEIEIDNLGSMVAHRKGSGLGPKILVAAHQDEVGWLVSHVTPEGYLRFRPLGGWWGHVMLAQRVQVMTANGPVIGIVGSKPPHVLQPEERKKVMELSEMFIDIGVDSAAEAERLGVIPGCQIAPLSDLLAMANPKYMAGKAWDNRAGCAAAVLALQELEGRQIAADVFVGADVQEEVGLRGARTLAQKIQPDLAIAVDVGLTGDIPGMKPEDSRSKLGQGVEILMMDGTLVPNPVLRDFVVEIAKQEGIPYQMDSLERGGTDGGSFQYADSGVPTLSLCIPTRYMHSHNVMLHRDDIVSAARLVAALIRRVDWPVIEQIRRREPIVSG